MATKLKLTVVQGNTFSQVVRWETVPFVFKPITDISRSAPVVITAAAHGIPDGWRAAVVSAGGMTKINATHFPVRGSDLKTVTVLSADSVALHDINSTAYTAYTSGGYLVYYTPVSLSGYTARMTIKDRVGGTVLATLTSDTGEIVPDCQCRRQRGLGEDGGLQRVLLLRGQRLGSSMPCKQRQHCNQQKTYHHDALLFARLRIALSVRIDSP